MSTDDAFRTTEPAGADPADDADERSVRALWSGRAPDDPGEHPPEQTRRAARAAYALRRRSAEVADLATDSACTGELRAGPGDEPAPRYLAFRSGAVTIHLEVTACGASRDIAGQITPGGATGVEVRWPRGARDPGVDADGAFVARGVPAGPVSVVVRHGSDTEVNTRWTRV